MGYYDEDYEPSEEELEEMEGEENTETDFDFKNLQINFDVENFARGIATAVKSTLKKRNSCRVKEKRFRGFERRYSEEHCHNVRRNRARGL